MEFAPSKSKLMRLGKGCQKFECSLGGNNLEYVKTFRYLGVVFEDNHRKAYIDVTKATKAIDQGLQRTSLLFSTRAQCPASISSLLLEACFMPKLLYAAEVIGWRGGVEVARGLKRHHEGAI